MARTPVVVQDMTGYGGGKTDITMTAIPNNNGLEFLNDGKSRLLVRNDHADPAVLVIKGVVSNRSFNHAIDQTATVATGEHALFGPFPQVLFGQSSGLVNVDCADCGDTDDILVAVLRDGVSQNV